MSAKLMSGSLAMSVALLNLSRARGRVRREQYRPRREWRVTHCLACDKRVEYIPKDQFNGTLKCPHCGVRFKVPSLDGFIKHDI
jgi:DNA-directed RNA polymerase subunit RPC12/RpoP